MLDSAGSLDVSSFLAGTEHTITPGTATARGGGTVTYETRWLVNSSEVATTAAYTPLVADEGEFIAAQWRAVESGGTADGETQWQTVGSGIISLPVWEFDTVGSLDDSTFKVGVTATASGASATAQGGGTVTYAYRTVRGATVIDNDDEYTFQAADVGETVAIQVQATETGGTFDGTQTAWTTVASGVVAVFVPTLTNVGEVETDRIGESAFYIGDTATASGATAVPEGGGTMAFAYRWVQGASVVDSDGVYTFQGSDDLDTLTAQVQGTENGGIFDGAQTAWIDIASDVVRYPPMIVVGALNDQTYGADSGVQTVDASTDFTSPNLTLTYSLSVSITGISINASSGVVSIDTDVAAEQSNTSVVVRATDQYGRFDETAFNLTISDFQIVLDEPNGLISLTNYGGQAFTITDTEDYDGTYSPTPAALADPVALVAPEISGATDLIRGGTITLRRALFAYDEDIGSVSMSYTTTADGSVDTTDPQAPEVTIAEADIGGGGVNRAADTAPGDITANGGIVTALTQALEVGEDYLIEYEVTQNTAGENLYYPAEAGSPFATGNPPSTVGVHRVVREALDTDTAAAIRKSGSAGTITIPWISIRKQSAAGAITITQTATQDGDDVDSVSNSLSIPFVQEASSFVTDFKNSTFRVGGGTSTFGDAVTFARASAATYLDSSGDIASVSSGAARTAAYAYDTELDGPFLLMEPAATNLITKSSPQVADGSLTNATAVDSTAILGLPTVEVTRTAASNDCVLAVSGLLASQVQSGTQYTMSAYFETDGTNGCRLQMLAGLVLLLQADGTTSTQSFSAFGAGVDDHGSINLGGNKWFAWVTATPNSNGANLGFWIWGGRLQADGSGITSKYAGIQVETGPIATSLIQTTGASASRVADVATIAAADAPYAATGVSLAMRGRMTYTDTGTADEIVFLNWEDDANNLIKVSLDTTSTDTGQPVFEQIAGGTSDTVEGSATAYAAGYQVPFAIASRHSASSINAGVGGTALTENATPAALADLSASDIEIAPTGIVMISSLHVFNGALVDDDLETMSLPDALGPELNPNPKFDNWSVSSAPDEFAIVGTSDAGSFVEENAAGLRLVSDGDLIGIQFDSDLLTVGATYRVEVVVESITGGIQIASGTTLGTVLTPSITSAGTYIREFTAPSTGVPQRLGIKREFGDSADAVISKLSIREIKSP